MYTEGMGKSTRIALTTEQREQLQQLIRAGEAPARKLTRARILLRSAEPAGEWRSAPRVAAALLVHPNTVRNVRRRFVAEGLAALEERPRPGARPKLTGEIEAELTPLACSEAPAGHAHWSLRLLADKLVEVTGLECLHHETVRRWLKKTRSSPGA
jgi:transposase